MKRLIPKIIKLDVVIPVGAKSITVQLNNQVPDTFPKGLINSILID